MAETANTKPRTRQRKKSTVTETTTIIVADKAVEHTRKDFEVLFEFDTDLPLAKVGASLGFTLPGETVYSSAKGSVWSEIPVKANLDHMDRGIETLTEFLSIKLGKQQAKVVDKKEG